MLFRSFDNFYFLKKRRIVINNYPIVSELICSSKTYKNFGVTYLGGLSKIRGAFEMIKAMNLVQSNVLLTIAGDFYPHKLLDDLSQLPGWSKVISLGFIDRSSVRNLLSNSDVGLVLYHSLPNHVESQPTKFFEYMCAGVPVVASDFPLWREIIKKHNCGLVVDPSNITDIAIF